MVRFLAALLVWPVTAMAGPPEACSPKEDPVVCMLKVERNNAMDELAISQGQRRIMETQEDALAKYWKEWVDGELSQADWWGRIWSGLPRKH
jgi:hypothetical protein